MTNPFGMPWLLPAPGDFKVRAKALINSGSPCEVEFRRLAAFALDLNELGTLGKAVRKHREFLIAQAGYTSLKLGIVASHTMDYLAAALPGTGLRHGLFIDPVLAGYGQAAQELLDPKSNFATQNLNFVLLAFDFRALGFSRVFLKKEEAVNAVSAAINYVSSIAAGVRDTIKATCILQTVVPPCDPVFGGLDGRISGSPRAMVESFNVRLLQEMVRDNDLVVDTAFLAGKVGLDSWNDARGWHKAKLPASLDATPLYADYICRQLGAARGRARKCLVLDLDNTLWGGVIGDDGLDGIILGQNTAVGEAHVALQRFLLDLRRRGVILAVCSKNENATARTPFREHPEMVLKEDHIAVFTANWSDKANNLREIAATLNIGTDSLVFLDDNPVERGQVREVLPEVAVPELTNDPADYIGLLANAGYFEAIGLSEEDLSRADFYQANGERVSLQKVGNLEEYLHSLQMVATVSRFNALGRARIAQLINKSNQFNLTTRRYSESELEAFEDDPDKFCLQVRLADRFGDNGMISVVIFDRDSPEWNCDTWLMSCRVLGRRVEEMVLSIVVDAARGAGAKILKGTYIPTKKNGMVADQFARLGFTKASHLPDGTTTWTLPLETYDPPRLPMQVIRVNDTATAPQAAREMLPSLPVQLLTNDSATGPIDVV
jgi:FkbH-like protein